MTCWHTRLFSRMLWDESFCVVPFSTLPDSPQPSVLGITNEASKVGARFGKVGEWAGKNLLESVFSGKVPG